MLEADTPATMEEIYGSAITSSNLRMEAREDAPNGAAAVLIAVGWCAKRKNDGRLGVELMRLHTEYVRASKGGAVSQARIEAIAREGVKLHVGNKTVTFTSTQGGQKVTLERTVKVMALNIEAAKATAKLWEDDEGCEVMRRLRSLPQVICSLEKKAAEWGVEQPREVALTSVAWWLNKCCPACEGRKRQALKGSASLSAKWCASCKGTGEAKIKHGRAGEMMVDHIKFSVVAAERFAQKVLQRFRPHA